MLRNALPGRWDHGARLRLAHLIPQADPRLRDEDQLLGGRGLFTPGQAHAV